METCVQIEHHPTCQRVIDRTGELMGQDCERLALGVFAHESVEIPLACGVISPEGTAASEKAHVR